MTVLSTGFVAGAGSGAAACAPPAAGFSARVGAGAQDVHLRIAATSDIHACLLGHDYFTDQPTPQFGLARVARQIAAARAGAANMLLLDNGDFLQGTALGDYVAQPRRRSPHPVIAAFNALGYDAGTLGNHEFNFGLGFLTRALAEARHPIVSANIARTLGATPTDDATFVPPFVILTRSVTDGAGQAHSLRIGIIGFTPPQILIWDRQHLEGQLSTRDILAAAQAWVPVMRARGADLGADLVIALSHSGIGPLQAVPGMENASTALAALPGIDAVIAGHSHLTFPSPLHPTGDGIDGVAGCLAGKPAVMPGHSGSHLGVIDLSLRATDKGWQVMAHAAEVWAARDAPALPRPQLRLTEAPVRRAAAPAHKATLAWARRRIGQTAVPLSTYFAHVADSAALRLVAAAQRAYAQTTLAGSAWAGLPVLAAVSPFKVGGRGGPQNYTHIPAGDLALRHAAALYIFPNTIAALCVSGADLALWLEHAAGQFLQVPDGSRDAPLVDPEFPSFNFDHLDGLTYRIDLSQPARFSPAGAQITDATRIRALCHQGQPVDPEARFIVATNSYRANGSGVFAGADPDHLVFRHQRLVRDVLRDHIATRTEHPAPPPQWQFAPQPGTSVTLDSHPDAACHLGLVPHLDLTPLGLTPDGFQRFRLSL
ncbi:MAG: bifunctional 2',3'-cyclic-nucleotide 2'-phosphodiesterase/3'-nucleotidase [Pseudomonadota bacterium]